MPRWVGMQHRDDPLGGYRMMLRRTGWSEGLRQLVVGPLHHAAPFTHLLAGLIDHHTILLQGVFEAARTWEAVTRHAVEWFQVTPTHMRGMSAAGMPARELLGSLRGVLHMAAPCDATTKRQWIDLLGGERVHEVYGATEQIGVTHVSGTEWLARPGTVGKGFLTRIRVADDSGVLPPGQVGTVYLRRATARQASPRDLSTVEHTPDGFLTVGDRGWLDEDGYLYLEGRRSDALQVGGASVFAGEIERVVQEVPGVRDVAVTGAPHRSLGTVPRALVTLFPGTNTDIRAIRQHCRRALAAHKVPHSIEIVSELPRSEAGKLQRWRISETPAEPESGRGAPAEEGTQR
jgi:bile acid-coenzyme A ligase